MSQRRNVAIGNLIHFIDKWNQYFELKQNTNNANDNNNNVLSASSLSSENKDKLDITKLFIDSKEQSFTAESPTKEIEKDSSITTSSKKRFKTVNFFGISIEQEIDEDDTESENNDNIANLKEEDVVEKGKKELKIEEEQKILMQQARIENASKIFFNKYGSELELMFLLIQGLATLHQNGVTHKDIALKNIVVGIKKKEITSDGIFTI